MVTEIFLNVNVLFILFYSLYFVFVSLFYSEKSQHLQITLLVNIIFDLFVYNLNMFNSIWYNSLNKPFLMPPFQLFSPVWIALYCTLIISFVFFVKQKSNCSKLSGYIFFAIQLALNILWSPVFFGLKQIKLGLLIIVFLDIFVYLTIIEFKKISKVAGNLLIPYFIWIIFATYLVISINVLNN